MLQFLLRPGVEIISRLSLSKKFWLIFILYLFPVGYISYYAITKHRASIAATNNEITTAEFIYLFKPVFVNMAKSRGLTNAYLNGNQGVQNRINDSRAKVDSQLGLITSAEVYRTLSDNIKK